MCRMKHFSAMQRLHLFVAAEYGCALSITAHDKIERREIFSSCPHRKKHLLQNYQWPGNENKQQHKVGTASGDSFVLRLKRELSFSGNIYFSVCNFRHFFFFRIVPIFRAYKFRQNCTYKNDRAISGKNMFE